MAFRVYSVDSIGPVRVYRHNRARTIRITLGNKEYVRVTVPTWVTYGAGLEFAKSRRAWIEKHHRPRPALENGLQIGKSHQLLFTQVSGINSVKTSHKATELYVKLPPSMGILDEQAQKAARKLAYSALRQQAEKLLPQQLAILANKYGYNYRSITIRRLKARWGSCNQHKDIVLNLQLMQLPWELINYVLLHELAHTRVLRHGPDFWAELETNLPSAKGLQKQLRAHQTSL